MRAFAFATAVVAVTLAACREPGPRAPAPGKAEGTEMEERLARYTTVRLSADVSALEDAAGDRRAE